MSKIKKIKGIKAFDEGLKCRGFQFKENEVFEIKEDPIICEKGFHFCENPLDVLNYYDLCDSEFAEVESLGKIDKSKGENSDTKISTNKIKIKTKIDLPYFIKLSFEYLYNSCKVNPKTSSKLASSGNYSKLATSGNYSKLASSGNYSKLASSGDNSQLASSGEDSKLASSGNYSKLATSGDYSQLASSGNYSKLASSGEDSKLASSGEDSKLASSGEDSKLASSGNYSKLASSGNYSKLASSGNYSQLAASGEDSKLASSGNYSQLASSGEDSKLASSGNYSKLASSGENSVIANIGIGGIAKGVVGSWITLAEYDSNWKPIFVKSQRVDGKKIKADTWYELNNKKFVEVKL